MAQIASNLAAETDNASMARVGTPPSPSALPKRASTTDGKSKKPAEQKVGQSGGASRSESKTDLVLKKLRLARGATIDMLMEATGWQAHSVRGFLSGTVRTKLGFQLSSEAGKDGVRRYRITDAGKGA
jgi:hypothetical protein